MAGSTQSAGDSPVRAESSVGVTVEHAPRVDPRRWWIPASLTLVMVGAAFALGGQYMASREAIKRLATVPTAEGVKLSILEAVRPMSETVVEMRAEQRAQNEATTAQIQALTERVTRLEERQ